MGGGIELIKIRVGDFERVFYEFIRAIFFLKKKLTIFDNQKTIT
jgi:hypothetical protein